MSSSLPGNQHQGSSLIGGQCDIFISYRQKDNLASSGGKGWVTEFVQALKNELEATFKEEISVYFDANPHDGLKDTHDVDDSLKEKVKCRVFIPIVSRTYCDPKSFAWNKELLPFLEFARNDGPGLKVTLPNGNVTSRVLPVCIHDIDKEDTELFEKETGGVMRGIDFVFGDAGVNRSLHAEDDRRKYRNQVNKVALALKETFHALQSTTNADQENILEKVGEDTNPSIGIGKKRKPNWLIPLAGSLVVTVALLLYFFLPGKRADETMAIEDEIDKSIAVLPFVNMSDSPDQEHFSDGMTDQIITMLTKVPDLKVIARTSVMQYKGTEKDIKEIAQELDVAYILEGSIQRSGDKIRVNAQLIRGKDNFHEWAEVFDRELENIFQVQDEISTEIKRALAIQFGGVHSGAVSTNNIEAYEAFLKGKRILGLNVDYEKEEVLRAIEYFEEAIVIDPVFADAYAELALCYSTLGYFRQANNVDSIWMLSEKNVEKCLEIDPQNTNGLTVMAYIKRTWHWDWEESGRLFESALKIDPNNAMTLRYYSLYLACINQGEKGLVMADKARKLNPLSTLDYGNYKRLLFYNRKFEETILHTDSSRLSLSSKYYIYVHQKKYDLALNVAMDYFKNDSIAEVMRDTYEQKGWAAFNILLEQVMRSEYARSWLYLDKPLDDNEKERWFEELDDAIDRKVGVIVYILVDPEFDPLRDDPRFDKALERLGLLKYKK